MDGCRANLGHHLVDQSHIGKRATSHDFIVSSARAVRVEVLLRQALRLKVLGSWGVLRNLSCWGDVIRRDRVSEISETVSIFDVLDRGRGCFG